MVLARHQLGRNSGMGDDIVLATPAAWDYRNKKVVVTGATGLIGRNLVDRLIALGTRLRTTSRRDPPRDFPGDKVEHLVGDLADRSFAERAMDGMEGLFHLAGRRGSIGIQRTQAATMLGENLMICFNVLDAARRAGVERILYTSTVTVYPPMEVYHEDLVWSGNPHPADQYAAWAKRMAEKFIEAQEIQYGSKNTAIVRPVNTFGPHDNFDPQSSHVIPALIRKFVEAIERGAPEVECWGTGNATREFLFVEDCAHAIVLATERYDGPDPVNIGAGFEIRIRDLAELVAELTGFTGRLIFDPSKPDGQPRRMLDVTRAKEQFDFAATTDFRAGLKQLR